MTNYFIEFISHDRLILINMLNVYKIEPYNQKCVLYLNIQKNKEQETVIVDKKYDEIKNLLGQYLLK